MATPSTLPINTRSTTPMSGSNQRRRYVRVSASNIDYTPVVVVANGVFAKLDDNGDVCVFNLAASHILIDVNAFLAE